MQEIATRLVLCYFVVVIHLLSFGASSAYSNSATVPLSIEVNGKLIITDEDTDNLSSSRQSTLVPINIDRSRNNFNILGTSGIRIRSNLERWKLLAKITELSVNEKRINPKLISIHYETSVGSKGNPNAARLIAPFNRPTRLSTIPKDMPVTVLDGRSKTSLDRDTGNHNNWFGLTLTAEYTGNERRARTNIKYSKSQYKAVVAYALVSL